MWAMILCRLPNPCHSIAGRQPHLLHSLLHNKLDKLTTGESAVGSSEVPNKAYTDCIAGLAKPSRFLHLHWRNNHNLAANGSHSSFKWWVVLHKGAPTQPATMCV